MSPGYFDEGDDSEEDLSEGHAQTLRIKVNSNERVHQETRLAQLVQILYFEFASQKRLNNERLFEQFHFIGVLPEDLIEVSDF